MEGVSLKELFKGRSFDAGGFHKQMKTRMAEADLPYADRSMTYNSRLAQELGKWADTRPGGEAIHDRLYRAYFVDNLNIADEDTLVSIADSVGLATTEAREVLEQRSFKDAVDEDWRRSAHNGITGVPTFFSRDLFVTGCQPYEILERFVKHLQKLQSETAS
jgi:predicted DsbA family dithiol-disulfide isomerase